MSTLYIECKMGAAGDMLMSALYDLLDEKQKNIFLDTMNNLLDNHVKLSVSRNEKCGIMGTHMHVKVLGHEEGVDDMGSAHLHHHHNHDHHHDHTHYSYQSVLDNISRLNIPKKVANDAISIYKIIGEAEAYVHGTTLENIHFHEVGSLDALADVVGNCLLISLLNIDKVICSPIHVGNGLVKCAHGVLPVPAPATSEILKGIPYYTGDIESELCTPTGAAILKHFSSRFDKMPIMNVTKVGIGIGNKDFPKANIVRAFLGEEQEDYSDKILEISCNIDDMTGEELGFAMEILFDAGALDVFYTNIYMKKNRPAILLSLICDTRDKDKFTELILKYTSTRGVRYKYCDRSKLSSSFEDIETPYGTVRKKISHGYGITKSKIEYEDLKQIAINNNLSIQELKAQLKLF